MKVITVLGLVLLTGCSSLPERTPEERFLEAVAWHCNEGKTKVAKLSSRDARMHVECK